MNVIDVDQKGKDDGSKKGFKIMIRRDIHQVINLSLFGRRKNLIWC
ncbi:protein of unknown function [Candidatus Nitrosocosmicus franklandus]|uniref:Uncharacterized protein n=1 Tax=Candidatus Nitrosocosmicus franklandianus TaxID=1798806 RepID=A0A484IE26_9ARCH|nr:protein of unknown function [Candidatus Nitrosocosmicus franklandus]